jgi:8-oxo-(d)GTP phosphatase
VSAELLLVRHASAGKRRRWTGDDRLRPLDERGRRQAEGLVATLTRFRLERILSSPYLRCTQTVEPLAVALGIPVEEVDELAEGVGRGPALAFALGLAGTVAVLCTHGDVVQDLVGDESPKGSTWVLVPDAEGLSPAELLPPTA